MAERRLTRIIVQALPCVDKPVVRASFRTVDLTENVSKTSDSEVVRAPVAPMAEVELRKKRGRPPKNPGAALTATVASSSSSIGLANNNNKRSKKEDEDVCFICFDGGNLVLCDRR